MKGLSYSATSEFGRGGEQEWLGSVNGVAYKSGRLYVFDQGRPAVLVLSDRLASISSFGREGEGPGEFSKPFVRPWLPVYWDFGWIAANDSAVVVFDHLRLSFFDPSGRFEHSYRYFGSPIPGIGTKYIGLDAQGQLLTVVDTFDARRPEGPRRLQVWHVGDQGQELAWTVELSPIRRTGGRGWTNLARDPRPFWARNAKCQVATDGTRRELFVFDEAQQRLDSIGLPEWAVPKMGSLKSDRGMVMVAPGQLRGTASPGDATDPVLRWSGLAMDPAGHAWLRLWTDPDSREEESVLIIDTATGETERIEVPAFPLAFGPPGVFYAMRSDPDTEEPYLVRYLLAPGSQGRTP